MVPDINAGLDQLQLLLQRMLELIEWREVTRPSPSFSSPASHLKDHVTDDLKIQYGAFLQLAAAIRQALEVPENCPSYAQRYLWRERLTELESQVRKLQMTERFMNS